VNAHSGLAGIAHWVNDYFNIKKRTPIDKRHPGIVALKEWVDRQYAEGRVTSIGDEELEAALREVAPELYTEVNKCDG